MCPRTNVTTALPDPRADRTLPQLQAHTNCRQIPPPPGMPACLLDSPPLRLGLCSESKHKSRCPPTNPNPAHQKGHHYLGRTGKQRHKGNFCLDTPILACSRHVAFGRCLSSPSALGYSACACTPVRSRRTCCCCCRQTAHGNKPRSHRHVQCAHNGCSSSSTHVQGENAQVARCHTRVCTYMTPRMVDTMVDMRASSKSSGLEGRSVGGREGWRGVWRAQQVVHPKS